MCLSANAYIGGVIAPGIRLAHDALVSRAAQLHKVDLLPPPQPIGRNTIHAMQSGIFWGYVGMIESLLQRILAAAGLAGNESRRHRRSGAGFQNAYRLD